MSSSEIQAAFSNSLSADTITIQGDNTQRGSFGSGSGGVFINRFGQISGKGTTVYLEGGGTDWADALSQTNIIPYYTRAQLMAVSSIKQYLEAMAPNTFVDEKI